MLLHLILGSAVLLAAMFTPRPASGRHRYPARRSRQAPHRQACPGLSRRSPGGCSPAHAAATTSATKGRADDQGRRLSAVVIVAARHCTELDCQKCRARSRWMRRKSSRARKSPKAIRN